MRQPGMKVLHPSFDPPENWRSREEKRYLNSREWKDLRSRILQRDEHTCTYCGHHADKYMTVDHIDGIPTNNDERNLQTVCVWCHMIKHSGFHCEIDDTLDLYLPSGLSQVEVIRDTRRLRDIGLSDEEVVRKLGLKVKRPFRMDHGYLSKLVGFITTRVGRDSGKVYGNIGIKGPDGRYLSVFKSGRRHRLPVKKTVQTSNRIQTSLSDWKD